MRQASFPTLLFALCFAFISPAFAQLNQMPRKTLLEVREACVEVLVNNRLRGGGAFIENDEGRNLVITAAHLFEARDAPSHILTSDDRKHSATLLAYDFGHDLALLEVESAKGYPSLPLASDVPTETAPIFNFGPALRRRTLVISGNVADARPSYTDFSPSDGYVEHFFVAGISPVLTSGGIWANANGEIVGIQHGRLLGDKGAPSSGLSIASPPISIKRLLRRKKSAATPGIGGWVWEIWTADSELLKQVPQDTEGLVVTWIKEGGPLDTAGVKRLDIILSCEGEKITRRNDFLHMIRSEIAGTSFELEITSPGTDNSKRKVALKTNTLESRWTQP